MAGLIEQLGGFAPLVFNTVKALIVLIVGWTIAGSIGGIVRR